MKRGEVWTAAGGKDYAGKPRPIVIVQDDRFDATSSITICAFTRDPTDAPLFRLVVAPSEANGLEAVSRLMVVDGSVVGRPAMAISRAQRYISSAESGSFLKLSQSA